MAATSEEWLSVAAGAGTGLVQTGRGWGWGMGDGGWGPALRLPPGFIFEDVTKSIQNHRQRIHFVFLHSPLTTHLLHLGPLSLQDEDGVVKGVELLVHVAGADVGQAAPPSHDKALLL